MPQNMQSKSLHYKITALRSFIGFFAYIFSSSSLSWIHKYTSLGRFLITQRLLAPKTLHVKWKWCQLESLPAHLSLSAICMVSSLEWVPLLKPFTSCSSRPSSSRMASLFTPRRLASTRGVEPLWLLLKHKHHTAYIHGASVIKPTKPVWCKK